MSSFNVGTDILFTSTTPTAKSHKESDREIWVAMHMERMDREHGSLNVESKCHYKDSSMCGGVVSMCGDTERLLLVISKRITL